MSEQPVSAVGKKFSVVLKIGDYPRFWMARRNTLVDGGFNSHVDDLLLSLESISFL